MPFLASLALKLIIQLDLSVLGDFLILGDLLSLPARLSQPRLPEINLLLRLVDSTVAVVGLLLIPGSAGKFRCAMLGWVYRFLYTRIV